MVDPTELEPPTFERAGRVHVHTPDGTKTAGYHGTIPERNSNGILCDRDSHKHRLRALDAYAFSISAISTMEDMGAGFVLVRETDTGDVYEWKFEAVRYADEVPDKFLDHPDDPQKYVPRDSARAVWYDHGGSVIIESDGEAHAAEFTRASDMEES